MREHGRLFDVPCDEHAKIEPGLLAGVVNVVRADFAREKAANGWPEDTEMHFRVSGVAEPHFALRRDDGLPVDWDNLPPKYFEDGIPPEGHSRPLTGYSTQVGWYAVVD